VVSALPTSTLAEATQWLRERADDGERCPCCRQFVKVYRRTINSTMARVLVLAHRTHGPAWFRLRDIENRIGRGGSSEAGKLRYWGLLEEETARRPDGGRSGWWRVTEKGAEFVAGAPVPKYARIYDGRLLGLLDGQHINIRDAFGTKFDFEELMRA
jgi:hypothetical protein